MNQPALTLTDDDIMSIAASTQYKDWTLHASVGRFDDNYVQWIFKALDNRTGMLTNQHCRKWRLSRYMTKSEVVKTIYRAVLDAEQHEVSEKFLYQGVDIFNHHISVDTLVEARKAELDMRAPV